LFHHVLSTRKYENNSVLTRLEFLSCSCNRSLFCFPPEISAQFVSVAILQIMRRAQAEADRALAASSSAAGLYLGADGQYHPNASPNHHPHPHLYSNANDNSAAMENSVLGKVAAMDRSLSPASRFAVDFSMASQVNGCWGFRCLCSCSSHKSLFSRVEH
jgi:hypothetical protein